LTDQQSDFEIVSSLDLDEIRKTTRESLVVHGVRCSVISRADAERGALQMGADEDLLSFLLAHHDYLRIVVWYAAFRLVGGKVIEGFLGKIGEEIYLLFKRSLLAAMHKVREPLNRRFNKLGRVRFRVEGTVKIGRTTTNVVVLLQFFSFADYEVQTISERTTDVFVDDMVDRVFGDVLPVAIEACRLAGRTKPVEFVMIEADFPGAPGLHVTIGNVVSLTLDMRGFVSVDSSGSDRLAAHIAGLFRDIWPHRNKDPSRPHRLSAGIAGVLRAILPRGRKRIGNP